MVDYAKEPKNFYTTKVLLSTPRRMLTTGTILKLEEVQLNIGVTDGFQFWFAVDGDANTPKTELGMYEKNINEYME